jgi:hypothetical protein
MATTARLTLDATTPQSAGPAENVGSSGSSVVVFPQASGTILLGSSNMTTATGARMTVAVGDMISIDIPADDQVFLLCASGTLAVDVLRFG